MSKKTLIGLFIAGSIVAALIFGCGWLGTRMREAVEGITNSNRTENPPPGIPPLPAPPAESVSRKILPLGNPSAAATNTANPNNYLLSTPFYSVSYNREKGVANWVSWQLTPTDFGLIERQNDFRPETRFPNGWTLIFPSDYTRSGFDRGHFCPSADRSASVESNSATFLMSNIAPQTPDLNRGPWEKLETYSRSIARRGNSLYIYAGQYGVKGKLKNKITVPLNYWKIVLVVPDGEEINAETRVIAVDFPNIDGIKDANWRDFRTTVRQLEQKTGYNFLQNLPPQIQNVLESKLDNV